VAESPYNADTARCNNVPFATQNGRDRNYMIGVGRVPHSHE